MVLKIGWFFSCTKHLYVKVGPYPAEIFWLKKCFFFDSLEWYFVTIHDVIDDVTQVETNVNLRESNSEVLVDIPNVLIVLYTYGLVYRCLSNYFTIMIFMTSSFGSCSFIPFHFFNSIIMYIKSIINIFFVLNACSWMCCVFF